MRITKNDDGLIRTGTITSRAGVTNVADDAKRVSLRVFLPLNTHKLFISTVLSLNFDM